MRTGCTGLAIVTSPGLVVEYAAGFSNLNAAGLVFGLAILLLAIDRIIAAFVPEAKS